jgi:ankyrin repeat protein
MHRLLSQGAQPDLRVTPEWRDTPLQMAVRLSYPEILPILIESGANVNAPPGRINGRTALQAAAEIGNLETVQFLLRKNANVNAPAGFKGGLTALQGAIRNGHSEVVELLLRSNAEIDAIPSPNEGLSAIEDTMSRKDLSQLDSLFEHESRNEVRVPVICAAAKFCWADGARYLLKHGSNVNSFYYDDHYRGHREICGFMSPLTWSIIRQDLDMVNLLLEFGANVKLNFDKKVKQGK